MSELRAGRNLTLKKDQAIKGTVRARRVDSNRVSLDFLEPNGARPVYTLLSETERVKLIADLTALAPASPPSQPSRLQLGAAITAARISA